MLSETNSNFDVSISYKGLINSYVGLANFYVRLNNSYLGISYVRFDIS